METEGLKAGQSTLEASVTLGDQHATFQQGPNLRALNQTHFLSHMESAGETYTNGKLSLLCFLCSPCLFLLSVHHQWTVGVTRGLSKLSLSL